MRLPIFTLVLTFYSVVGYCQSVQLQTGRKYTLYRLQMGTNKMNALEEEDKLRDRSGSQFKERKNEFELMTATQAKTTLKAFFKEHASQIKSTDTLIVMDWDMEKFLEANGSETGIFHRSGNKVSITKPGAGKGKLKVRHFLLKSIQQGEFEFYDEDNPELYSHYFFRLVKEKKKN